MSNKTQLQANNTQLASLIQELQGKAAGGAVASVETCEVSVSGAYFVFYTGVENGEPVAMVSAGTSTSSSHTFTALRNSMVMCGRTDTSGMLTASSYGYTPMGKYGNYYYTFKATDENVYVGFSVTSGGGSN